MSCPHCVNGMVHLLTSSFPCEHCNVGNEAPEIRSPSVPRYVEHPVVISRHNRYSRLHRFSRSNLARHLKDPRPLLATLKWGGKTFQVADEDQLMRALHRNLRSIDVYAWDQTTPDDFKLKFKQHGISHKSNRPVTFLTTMTGEGTPGDVMDMLHNILFMQSPWYDSVRVNASRAIGMIRQHIMDEGATKNPASGVMSSSLKLDYAANAARRIDAVAQLVSQWWTVHRCSIAGRCVDLGNHEEDNALAVSVNAGSECVQFCHTYLPGAQTVELRLNVLTK